MSKRGVSPSVSYVLILGIVVITALAGYYWGSYQINQLQDIPIANNVEAQMITVDSAIQNVAKGDINFTTTIDLFYSKGVIQVDETNEWVKFKAQLNAKVFESEVSTAANATCDDSTFVIADGTIKLTRIQYTNVFRGGEGTDESQQVVIVACYDDIDISANSLCLGKSGPRSQLTVRKIGFTGFKPRVEVSIC